MKKIQDMEYAICIVTRGRVDEQFTLRNLSKDMRKLVTIICHPGELKQHKSNYGKQVLDIIEYGSDCQELGSVRDWVMNYYKELDCKYVIFLDDNLSFGARYSAVNRKVRMSNKLLTVKNNFNEEEQDYIYVEMFSWIVDQLDDYDYGVAGISCRQGNNRKTEREEENTRIFACWGISVEKFFSLKYRFKDNPSKEDFHIQLGFLTNGIKTICNNMFTFDKVKGANANGGCSIFRTFEYSNNSSRILKQYFPDFVTITEKDSNNWKGFEGRKRLEVIIRWKKAYESSFK